VKLEQYKHIFIAVGLIGVLLVATPALGMVLNIPTGKKFSELYVLGPGHMAEDYPFNVVEGQKYSVYVGVGNHMAASVYYVLYVKFKNQTEPLPNATIGAPSPLQPLYEYRFFVADGETWESSLVFSISEASFTANQSAVKRMAINNVEFDVDKPAEWDMSNTGFYYQLFLELWTFDPQSNSVQFDNRFVGIHLNLTTTTA
jgi:hypothetical protein